MKVKELTAYIAQKISEGKLREDSEVLIGSDEFGGLYLYSPDRFHMVCMSEEENFYKQEVIDDENRCRHRTEKYDTEYNRKDLAEKTELLRKVNHEWKDALVI